MEQYSSILHKVMGGGGGGHPTVSHIGNYNKPVHPLGNVNRVIKVMAVSHHNGSKQKRTYI